MVGGSDIRSSSSVSSIVKNVAHNYIQMLQTDTTPAPPPPCSLQQVYSKTWSGGHPHKIGSYE